MKMKLYTSKQWLWARYVRDGLTVSEIAKQCGVSYQTIQNYLEKFDLIRNQRSWSK